MLVPKIGHISLLVMYFIGLVALGISYSTLKVFSVAW